jgi:hypothetical protein
MAVSLTLRKKILMRHLIIGLIAFCSVLPAQEKGHPLPAWSEGTLDIHQINTGKGNATFFILPDGTTMLLDAGSSGRAEVPRGLPIRPDNSKAPGEWIARYIARVSPSGTKPSIDYALLTHFHDDHMGAILPSSATSEGGYRLTGITEVGTRIPIHTMLDRGWPDYSYPVPQHNPMLDNYRAFLTWQTTNRGLKVERFVAGRNDQIHLLRAPKKYPDFEIRNVIVNTEVWTGVGNTTRLQFPPITDLTPEAYPDENRCSLGFRLSYGKFDYGTFGDIPGRSREGGPPWEDLESAVAKAVGPVEAVVLNHHGNRDSANAFYLASLRPQVLVESVWSSDHPGHDVLERILSQRIYPGTRDLFATGQSPYNIAVIGGDTLARLTSSQGHVVIRVEPGGAQFRVFVLDDTNESMNVIAVHGPYQSR